MNPALTAGAGVAGAAIGLGAGWLSVFLEGRERLEEEENEERAEYEAEVAKQAEEAGARGDPPEPALPWLPERYGWTWLEWGLAPVLAAFGFSLFAGHQGLTWVAVEDVVWVAVFVQIIVFDIKHRLILDKVTLPAIVLALVLAAVTPGLSFFGTLIGGAAVGGLFALLHLVSRRGIGLGDAKLGTLVGAVTGLGFSDQYQAAYAVVAAVLIGGVVALLLLISRLRSLKDPIPYGPFLCIGAAVVLFQGPLVT
ncbi:MAG TPA: A24 family peptidase [Candidatus Binatia bacterium]|nr:A24 family peptidase [Candidatus Binatia bacterium]